MRGISDNIVLNEKMNPDYWRFQYEKLRKNVLEDSYKHISFRGFFYKKFKREDIEKMCKHIYSYEYSIRALSRYLYIISHHYKRLINYFSQILT